MRGTCLYRSTFDGTVMVYDGVTEFGQGRAAALLTSVLARDDRGAKASV
jgi:hypothetical protein